jgi:hypothetical protein
MQALLKTNANASASFLYFFIFIFLFFLFRSSMQPATVLDANGSASSHADKRQTDCLFKFKSMCAYVLKQALTCLKAS